MSLQVGAGSRLVGQTLSLRESRQGVSNASGVGRPSCGLVVGKCPGGLLLGRASLATSADRAVTTPGRIGLGAGGERRRPVPGRTVDRPGAGIVSCTCTGSIARMGFR